MISRKLGLRPIGALSIFAVIFAGVLSPGNGERAHAQIATLFSVSPDGLSGLEPMVIYAPSPTSGLPPEPIAGGAALGLTSSDDVLGSFSKGQDPDLGDFLLCFSVDEASVGAVPPLGGSGGSGGGAGGTTFAYNVTDQSSKTQAAGDAFISTKAYSLPTGKLPATPDGPSMTETNNVLAINQSDPYVATFGLLPLLSPDDDNFGGDLDDVNGGESADRDPGSGEISLSPLYFSVDDSSPSLAVLSGTEPGSAANIFYDPSVDLAGGASGDTSLFATASELGLDIADKIVALSVFDASFDGLFNETDQVLFSLAPGSPSLASLGASPGDILTVSSPSPAPSLFAAATDLGLDPIADNVNMLVPVRLDGMIAVQRIQAKLTPVPEPSGCAWWLIGLAVWRTLRSPLRWRSR